MSPNNLDLQMLEEVNTNHLSSPAIRRRLESLLGQSSRLQVILETVNHDTGEFRITVEGVLDREMA